MVSSNFALAVCLTSFTASTRSFTRPAWVVSSKAVRYRFPCFINPPWFMRAANAGTPTSSHDGKGLPHRHDRSRDRGSACFFLDGVELGFGGVTFPDDPFESLDEVVDARSRSAGNTLAHDVVDLARRLAPQQQLGVFLFQANHPVPSLPNQRPRCPCCGPCP